jgi:hypothetical protein
MDPGLTMDWAQFDPRAYLHEYYGDVGAENLALLRFLIEAYQDLPPGGVLLDFGGGPTIYPLISAASRVAEIHFSDYLEANLEEVRRWLAADPQAFDWTAFVREALELEFGCACSDSDVAERESEIRKRVTKLMRCDASRMPPIDGLSEQYDILVTNFCAESATADRWQWQASVGNIVSLLKPGGKLIMSALKGATRYAVGSRSFPAVDISEEDLIEQLEESGFPRKGIEVRSIPADHTAREYTGLILAIAEKDGAGHGSV